MNIFLTVGSMFPFDRLVKMVDRWADSNKHSIFAQIGDTSLMPSNLDFKNMISPAEYNERCEKCDIIVSHVGMGTVILASELKKPLVAMPRIPELKEVTSNHQVATAKWLKDKKGIIIVNNESEFRSAMNDVSKMDVLEDFGSKNQEIFVAAISNIIQEL